MNDETEAILFLRKHLTTSDGVRSLIKHLMQKGQQNIHTPFSLCREMIGKLKEFTPLSNKKIAVLFNVEFVQVLIRDFGVCVDHVVMFADDEVEYEFCKLEYGMKGGVNLFQIDMEKSKEEKELYTREGKVIMKFDVVVMNPPYQDGERKGGGVCASNILWDKFVVVADKLLVENGFIAAVHPSLWRKPNSLIQKTILANQLHYMEIHNEQDGIRIFGAETRYDWYISEKTEPKNKTTVLDQDGKTVVIDLRNSVFIPNCQLDMFQRLVAREGEEKVEIISDSSYHTQNTDRMSKERTEKFKHPCVYTVPKSGTPNLWWSSTAKRGHFGQPKLIYSTGRPISVGFYVDDTGKYGITQFSSAIVESTTNLYSIQRALQSDRFREFCSAISIGKLEVNTHVIKLFRKDFWKEFI